MALKRKKVEFTVCHIPFSCGCDIPDAEILKVFKTLREAEVWLLDYLKAKDVRMPCSFYWIECRKVYSLVGLPKNMK